MDHVQTWTLAGFLAELQRITEHMPDRRFVFILGAGASIQSGVKSAHALAIEWMEIIHHREIGNYSNFDEWLDSNPFKLIDWDSNNIARFYPYIFEHCFSGDHDAGYAALEKVIESGKPSFGYAVLAWIMTNTSNNMVITTNFDNLVADSLYLYGQKTPHVIGHESLASYLKPLGGRPMVAKIHRDLFTDPINDSHGTSELKAPWVKALKSVFKFYTPIFIGYGGNDGSLMNFLSALSPNDISGRPFWCYYEPAGKPNGAINTLLEKHKGVLVPTSDWDTLMLSIGNAWDYQHQSQIDALDRHMHSMKETLQQQILQTSQDGSPEVKEKLKPIDKDPQNKSWFDWSLEAHAEENLQTRLAIYQQGLQELPDSHQLHNWYAFELKRNNFYDEAEQHYIKSLEIRPDYSSALYGYAQLLNSLSKLAEAEVYYKRAIQVDPSDADTHNGYANLLSSTERLFEAEEHYQKALETSPDVSLFHCNYADLLTNMGRFSESEKHYKRAIDITPDDPYYLTCYADMLKDTGDIDEARVIYRKALNINPEDIIALYGHAECLEHLGHKDEAEEYRKRAQSLSEQKKSSP